MSQEDNFETYLKCLQSDERALETKAKRRGYLPNFKRDLSVGRF